jgi:HemY protein
MKLILLIVFLLIALATGIFFGPELIQNKWYVLIGLDESIVEMRFNTLVFMILFVFFALYLLFKLVRLLSKGGLSAIQWTTDSRGKRAKKRCQKALLAMAEGQWEIAGNLLEKSTKTSQEKLQTYLSAAFCANQLGRFEKRDGLLTRASAEFSKHEESIALAALQMQMTSGQWTEAAQTLTTLSAHALKYPHVLLLRKSVYVETQNHEALADILTPLRKQKLIGENEWIDLNTQIKQNALKHLVDAESLQAYWKKLPKAEQAHPAMIELYAQRLLDIGETENAENTLKKAIKKHQNQSLLVAYCQLPIDSKGAALKFVESQLDIETASNQLLMAVSKLAFSNQLWGVAQSYLDRAQSNQPTAEGFWLQAKIHKENQNLEKARRCYEQGMALQFAHTNSDR